MSVRRVDEFKFGNIFIIREGDKVRLWLSTKAFVEGIVTKVGVSMIVLDNKRAVRLSAIKMIEKIEEDIND